jgi:hypothetical protein
MEVQAKLQIGDNESQIYRQNYNVVNLFCHFSRVANNIRPDSDACCKSIDITLVAPSQEDLALYDWYISGQPLCGRVALDLADAQADSSNNNGNLVFENAYCFAIEEEYHIDKQMLRTIKLSLVADKVTFEGATFTNPYNNN